MCPVRSVTNLCVQAGPLKEWRSQGDDIQLSQRFRGVLVQIKLPAGLNLEPRSDLGEFAARTAYAPAEGLDYT